MRAGKLMGASVFTAIAASLCCLTPVLALIAGSGSIASSFSWIEPARPYMIGLTFALLGFAWYQKLKPQSIDDCDCAVAEKPKFLHSKTFLLLVTLFAILMITFPSYTKYFQQKAPQQVLVENSNVQRVVFHIQGMSCEACEGHVNSALLQKKGVQIVNTSYARGESIVKFDRTQISLRQLATTLENETGYKVDSFCNKLDDCCHKK